MAWPRCPECGSEINRVLETRDDAAPVEPVVYRQYTCECGCFWHTAEKLIDVRPGKRWLRRTVETVYVSPEGKSSA